MSIHPALKALAKKRRQVEPEKYDEAVDSGWLEVMTLLNAEPATGEIVELPDGITHEILEDFDHIMLANLMDILTEDSPQNE
jgi:hypothetical protein